MNALEYGKIRKEKLKAIADREWYSCRSLFGNTWAFFYFLIGGREAGKSYNVMEQFVKDWKRKGKPFTWLRLTEASSRKLLNNNADKFVDPDLMRKYDLKLTVKGCQVYDHKKPMAKILALSTFYSDKGVALYDNEYDLGYNICLDEMNRERCERNGFDIPYALVNQLENLVRSTKEKLRIVFIGNTTIEASDILALFNFIPEEFGRYKLRKKKAVIDYIEPSKAYLERRKGTVANLLAPTESTFTNKIDIDKSLVDKRRLKSVSYVIKFSKDKTQWFACYDGIVLKRYNGETCKNIVAMRPYIDEVFVPQQRDSIFGMYDAKAFHYRDLITQRLFKSQLENLKARK